MANISESIVLRVLNQTNKLLIDHKLPGGDPTQFERSQFNLLFPYAYAGNDRTDKYPITEDEIINLEEGRLLNSVKIGFIPLAKLKEANTPALYITGATDMFATEIENEGNIQQAQLYPVNLRLVLKEPDNATQDTSNIIVASRIREALGYVLDYSFFYGMSAERRGYDLPSTVWDAVIRAGQNLEEFATPFEVIDYRFETIFVEQKSLNANQQKGMTA